ncbi:type VII secretion protein EccB [Streptomyces triticirhizae]|uniref:Type VII secretion protein EccB n=1 Tax=Streptomyces triticirhizae TaxID=2483353 RepID=A0A3M2KTE5_9ACTN|nr:type VII secretion protein EccB [Streptomyces triticirhizae]RMI26775.1 type VII secretion protein EccB [Streptomyces triticirhizae]
MATTREQAEAYGYANRRLSTALFRGADEARLDPRRRHHRALGGGVAVAVLIMAGFGIAGWLGGGRGPDLPAGGAVVAGTGGDPYVIVEGVAHPALNLASALLAGGGQLTEVRRATLDEAPRGLPVGIPGAPDALPDADDLLDGEWTLCATPSEAGGDPVETALYVAVPGVAPTGPGATLLAAAEDGGRWLLTEGRRYALGETEAEALALRGAPVRLPREVLATVPEAPAIAVPEPDEAYGTEPTVELPFDAVVGDVAHTPEDAPARRWFVVRPDGLVAVPEVVYALLSSTAGADHEIGATDATRAPRSAEAAPGEAAWPEALPVVDEPERDRPVCVSTPPGSRPGDAPWQATAHLPAEMPEPADVAPVEASRGGRLGLLDRVYVPAGAGALVRSTASGGGAGTYTLVTDGGTAYPLASPDAARRLGYDPEAAPSVPRAYAELLPTGPVLDPVAATREQDGTPEDEAPRDDASEDGGERADGARESDEEEAE